MRIIDRYIAKIVISYTLLISVLFYALAGFLLFMGQMHDIGKYHYGIDQALYYVCLVMPQNLYQLFPMAGLLGALIGLGRLASSSELVVMRTAGVSLAQINWSVIKAAILMLLIAMPLGEIVAPHLQYQAVNYRMQMLHGKSLDQNQYSTWIRQGNDFYRINTVTTKGTMQGITRYHFGSGQKLLSASYAAYADYANHHWVFHRVRSSIFDNHQVITKKLKQAFWQVSFGHRLFGIADIKPQLHTLLRLYQYIRNRASAGLNTDRYELVFWQRLLQPLAFIVMILLALPFIFGPLRSSTTGLRMMLGIVLGFLFYVMNRFAGLFGVVYQLPPLLIAIVPLMLFTLLGFWLIRRVR